MVIGYTTVTEGGAATLTLTRSGGTGAFALSYAISDGAAGLSSATAGSDYTAANGTVSFAAGQNTTAITVATIDDGAVENSEGFTVTLSNATAGATIATAVGVVTIVDNDVDPPTPPPTPTPTPTPVPTPPPAVVGDTTYVSATYIQPEGSTTTVISTRNNSSTDPINLTGNSGTATIVGNYGGNVIDGGPGGSDTLIGLLGDDTYIISNPNMVVQENGGEGFDTVIINVAVTTALPKGADAANPFAPTYVFQPNASIEVIRIGDPTSTAAVNVTGSTASQSITGNNGDNIINGFGGSDTMIGLGGNDQYLVRGPGDVVIEANGGGNDTVFTTVSYNLGVNEVEVLSTVTNSDTTPINLIGNFATQTIIGNYGSNVLNGGSGGLDALIGLRGDDIYAVGDSRTVIIENSDEGSDTVVASVDYALAAGVSVEVLAAQDRAGTAPLALRGNEVAQTIAGNNGSNILDGGLGNDTLVGGGGADSFRFTTALGPNNVDSIADFEVGTDKIGLGASIFGTTYTAANFTTGMAATTADHRIIYNQATGQLFFDADGNGSSAAVLFALVSPGLALTAASFEIIPTTNIA